MAERGGAHRLAEPMVHSCGFESWYATGYAMHAKHCNGTRPATEGRIAAREQSLAVVPAKPNGRPRKPVDDERTERRRATYRKSSAKRRGNGHADPPAPIPAAPGVALIRAAATDKAMELTLIGLRARRLQLDTAIAALEAIS